MSASLDLDPTRTLQLAFACKQTYEAFNRQDDFLDDPETVVDAPPGTTFETYWQGLDVFDGRQDAAEVVFGLVYSIDETPGSYIFAFRGTAGLHEWIDDAKISHTSFRPFAADGAPPLPDDACAEEGFEQIYGSMQPTLFSLLDKYQPSEAFVTGHSLGSALCELFVLDLLLSRPSQPFTAVNFAAPRFGSRELVTLTDRQLADQGRQLVRVVNTKDLVPRVPPRTLRFAHPGVCAPVCFEESGGVFPDYGVRHSMANYFRTLQHVFDRPTWGVEPSADDAHGTDPQLSFCTPDPSAHGCAD